MNPQRTNAMSRRASWTFVVIGILALFMASMFAFAGANPDELRKLPTYGETFGQFEQQGMNVAVILYAAATMVGLYAVACIVVGLLLRGAGRAALVTGMVLAGGSLAYGLVTLLIAATRNLTALPLALAIIAVFALLLHWLREAWRSPVVGPTALPPVTEPAAPGHMPMAGYYAPYPPR